MQTSRTPHLTRETRIAFMEEIRIDPRKVERAFLVGVQDEQTTLAEAEDHLNELASLSDTMGVDVVGRIVARVLRPTPHFYLGQGKAEEIKALALGVDADVLIFDIDLSPSQQRNWEKFTEIAVIDRQEVILDIFAGRAQTREARLQVGLARMNTACRVCRRAWRPRTPARRCGPSRGPGESSSRSTADRYRPHHGFRRELKEVRQRRAVQRRARRGRPVPTAAIVGYTNVGKSSLLRRLTGADVFVEDKLFATLDTTTRRIELPGGQPLLLTDTVGFIRKLPHGLVEAFKATLEEAVEADFLVHVLDITHPKIEEHYRVTNQVLSELGAGDKPTIVLLNKADQPHDPLLLNRFRLRNPLTFVISTQTGDGIDAFLNACAEHFTVPMRRLSLVIPQNRYDLVSLAHTEGTVITEDFDAERIRLEVELPIRFAHQFEEFIDDGGTQGATA